MTECGWWAAGSGRSNNDKRETATASRGGLGSREGETDRQTKRERGKEKRKRREKGKRKRREKGKREKNEKGRDREVRQKKKGGGGGGEREMADEKDTEWGKEPGRQEEQS